MEEQIASHGSGSGTHAGLMVAKPRDLRECWAGRASRTIGGLSVEQLSLRGGTGNAVLLWAASENLIHVS